MTDRLTCGRRPNEIAVSPTTVAVVVQLDLRQAALPVDRYVLRGSYGYLPAVCERLCAVALCRTTHLPGAYCGEGRAVLTAVGLNDRLASAN